MTQRVVYSWTIRLQVRAGCLNFRYAQLCAPALFVRPCMRTACLWPASVAQPKLPRLLADLAHTSKQLWPPKVKATALPLCKGEQKCPEQARCRSLPGSQLPLLAPQAAPPCCPRLPLQGAEAGPELANCWLTEAVQPISQNLFGGRL